MSEISLEEAVSLLLQGSTPLGTERLPLEDALHRTLAVDVTAALDQPPFDRSPLDGYALRAADLAGASPDTPVRLRVVDTLCAGDAARTPVCPGEAVRIMTGAMLPPGCDCVLRQEDTDQGRPFVSLYKSLDPHDNYCERGEDFRTGSLLLPAGTRIDAAAIGVLASAGICTVPVRRRPRVAILSTGDEVVAPGVTPLPEGKIYGSNLPLLTARLRELGLSPAAGEQIGDDPSAVATALARLLTHCDLLLTTGGVSVGDKDIFHQALPLLGADRLFWRVNLKPGTPAMFSRWQGKPILSLSGNPFAAAATFELLARPLLSALSGEPELDTTPGKAVLESSFPKPSPIRRFLRGNYQSGRVSLPGAHSSGVLSSLVGCNCLVDVPGGSPPLEPGQRVRILLL